MKGGVKELQQARAHASRLQNVRHREKDRQRTDGATKIDAHQFQTGSVVKDELVRHRIRQMSEMQCSRTAGCCSPPLVYGSCANRSAINRRGTWNKIPDPVPGRCDARDHNNKT